MIDIGSTNFLINVPSLPRDEFERYSTSLFDEWDKTVEKNLIFPDYSISLEIEEGSIKGGGRIAVALGALYFGIGNYGDFISGLKTIGEQVSYVNSVLFENARAPFGCSNVNAKVRKSGGAIARLHGLFDRVQRGLLTTDEAMLEAITIFGKDGNDTPDFIQELRQQLERAPRHPVQLSLADDEWEKCNDDSDFDTKSPTRTPRPKPPQALISQHYRIEIWRESKKDKKRVKVTEL